MADRRPVVILSTADFDSPLWTNKQHIASRLANERPTTYVESLGLRRPTFSAADLRRIMRRLRRAAKGPSLTQHGQSPRPDVVAPLVIPLHGSPSVRWVNEKLIRRTIGRAVPALPSSVLWTFSPLTYGLEQRAVRTIYHAVDLIHEQKGMPRRAILDHEKALCETADFVVASSVGVQRHLTALGRTDVLLWENVADTTLFAAAAQTGGRREARAVFFGNLSPSKVDVRLLTSVANAGLKLSIAGPIGIDGTSPDTELHALLSHRNVTYLGVVTQDRLAQECARSRVGLIPYRANDYTAGVFPMKVYEYLAAGLSVVATGLPSLEGREIEGLALVRPEAFVGEVQSRSTDFAAEGSLRRQAEARAHSWESRIEQMRPLLDD